ncbi:male sterility protein-domain-containing protein [Mycena crocata]|nr:male sterility protein-domain-containing protein [Mycena crocata]
MLDSPPAFFRRQTVFITGATGSLGGCLLFKLVLKLDVDKIYVLVRGSAVRAEAHWMETMPDHIGPILRTRKIVLVEGEMTESDFGIAPSILAEMASVVTLIIHAAANIHLKHSLEKTVRNNCLSSLELARMASKFKCLSAFVHLSSAYCNSFLPDGIVEEKIYIFGNPDAEKQLSEILDTGFPSEGDVSLFTSPYALGKYLTERLLSSRFPHLPLLIIRPTITSAKKAMSR